MSTCYYMVKGEERVYVGSNTILYDIDGLHDALERIHGECWVEREIVEIDNKKVADLTWDDYKLIMREVDICDDAISLFEHPYLLAFFLLHDKDWDEWDLKTDYDLRENK